MRTDLFDYSLPEERIATRPPAERDGGRMCVVEEGGVRHEWVRDFPEQLSAGDLVVLNETRVRQARLYCTRPTREAAGVPGGAGGARVEILFLHPVGENRWAALGRANKPLRPGDEIHAGEVTLRIADRGADGTLIVETSGDIEPVLLTHGQMPIPPYMQRTADEDDVTRYQTVFARELGSAAAPTAGLHVTEQSLARLQERGARVGRLTLHVGIGTFRPVSVEDLDAHPMHEETFSVSEELRDAIAETHARGGRVVAVGTTAVRALESAAVGAERGQVRACRESTRLLIQPGFEFRVVDALLTNFHQPKSTLLALVSALVGRDRLLAAYGEALERDYRFLSYGDAMWIPRRLL